MFKEIGNELPPVWEFKDEGDSIEGIYARKKTLVGKNKANMYYIEKDLLLICPFLVLVF